MMVDEILKRLLEIQDTETYLLEKRKRGFEEMMAAAWFNGLKRSIKTCKGELSDIVQRNPKDGSDKDMGKPCLCRSGCSKSFCNHRDVDHGRKNTQVGKSEIDSRRSIGSHQIIEPVTHLVLTDSNCELKITRCYDNDDSSFVGVRRSFSRPRNIISMSRRSFDAESQGFVCQKCGEKFKKLEAIEAHHLSRHAVTPLPEGDSSRKVVEMICQTNLLDSGSKFGHIERILKVHNLQISLSQFEDYRELVKLKANKQSNKHPRCMADGNELLRFYGTTVACTIGMKSSSTSLCPFSQCGVCCILRNGFSPKEHPNGFRGIFTSSTSKRAFECLELDEENRCRRKGLLVCRVIAGRVHKPLDEDLRELAAESSFDSVAANADSDANIQELYSVHPRALLPCFVVICKPSKQSARTIT